MGPNDPEDLSHLSEVEIPTKMGTQESWKANKSNSNILTIQISMIIASMLSIFYPSEPHIMTKILAAFRDVMSLSPRLFTSFHLQIVFNIFLFIPLVIVIGLKYYKNSLQSENLKVDQTLSLFKKILNVFTIPIQLHTGSTIGTLLTSIPHSVAMAISAILVQIIWNYTILILEYPAGFGHDFNILIVWLIENTPAIVFALYSLIFYAFQHSVGVFISTFCTILLSSFFVYLILGTSLFSGRRHNAVATIAGFVTFTFTNLLQYLVPSKTVYWLTFAYISMNVIAIFGEWKLPTPVNKKTRKINKGNMQTYDDGPNDGEKKSLRKFISMEKQDIATLGVFIFGILFMTLFNAMAARQMPVGAPLPDFIHNIFHTGEEIRGSKTFLEMQFSNLLCVVYIAFLSILCFICPDVANARKFLLLYGVECVIRALSFVITSMPAPCAGLPNCPCADPKELDRLRSLNPLKIALTWTFGFGMFAKLPQCGDLIVSGHTMFMWQSSRWIMETTSRMLPTLGSTFVKLGSLYAFLIGICYITLSRNHYTIDIWFGFLLSEGCFYLYGLFEERIDDANNNSIPVKILRWFETRKYPIMKEEYESDDSSTLVEV